MKSLRPPKRFLKRPIRSSRIQNSCFGENKKLYTSLMAWTRRELGRDGLVTATLYIRKRL